MLTGLTNYLFGPNEFTDDALENLLKETPIKGVDGDDWILVELRHQQQQQLDSDEQSGGCPGNNNGIDKGDVPSSESTALPEEDKEDLKESSDGHKQSTKEKGEGEGEEEEGDLNVSLINSIANNDAKNQKTAEQPIQNESHENSNNSENMEESWFVTPPPCFVSHKESIHEVSASPLEDILIEHPSISVFHSQTSSSLESFYPVPPQTQTSLEIVATPPSSQHSVCPTLHLLPSTRIRFANLTSLATVAVSSIVALATPPASSNRSNRSNRGQRNGLSSNNRNNNRLDDDANQASRTGETREANLENHERNDYLSEITNHHLAPMQKAMNQGSQKYLKKSFLDRQNLVKIQSNRRPTRRQRCTQRPSGFSNNRKMC